MTELTKELAEQLFEYAMEQLMTYAPGTVGK